MPLLVGVDPGRSSAPALHLAALLARSADTDLVVTVVIGRSWMPSMAKVDQEWQDHTRAIADAALERAREVLGDGTRASYVVHEASSTRRGLAELAERNGCELIVIGSAADGPEGRTSLGSVSNALLHSSAVPVAVAPAGFEPAPGVSVSRVTAAYGGSEAGADLVVGAATVTAGVGAVLRIAAFAVRPKADFAIRSGAGGRSEEPVLSEWAETIRARADAVLDDVEAMPDAPAITGVEIGIGDSWAEALGAIEWTDTDVLVVGSSGLAPVARVFLGSHATKVVRNSPVPVIVVPRRALG